MDVRTVGRDIGRLRALGYPVEAAAGLPGYRLGAGANLAVYLGLFGFPFQVHEPPELIERLARLGALLTAAAQGRTGTWGSSR